jgi:hypothetical protein
MWKTFSQSDCSSLIKYARTLLNIELERRTYIHKVSQAGFIKIPFPRKDPGRINPPHPLVCRKRRLNGTVLRMRLEKPRSRVKAGLARCKTKISPFMWKTFSQSDYSSLIRYALNFSNIELERGTYVPSITSKLDIHGICQTLNLSEGLVYMYKQVSSKSHHSLRRYPAENIQPIRLQQPH